MKKIIVFALTLCLTVSLSVTAFARTMSTVITPNSPDSQSGSMSVTYGVDPSYTVTIPASVELGNTTAARISVSNVILPRDVSLGVAIIATSGTENAFTLTSDDGSEITYVVKKGSISGDTVNINSAILVINTAAAGGASGSADLYFIAPSTSDIAYAGDYSGTVTFKVSTVSR